MTKKSILKAIISLFIILFTGLQAFTSFRVYTYIPLVFPPASQLNLEKVSSPQLWPFLTYPMYRNAHYEGDEIVEYEAYAIFKDSTEVNVLPKDVNIGFWRFRWDFVPAIRKNNRSRIKDYVSLIKERYKRKPVGLRLEVHPWIVQKKGAVEASPEVLAKVRIATDSTRR